MDKLFVRHSNKWFLIGVGLFLTNLFAILNSAIVLNKQLDLANAICFVILAALISISITLGGIFKFKLYFSVSFFFDLLAIAYMTYISIGNTAEGWSDLVSIVSYIFTAVFGIILGSLIQVIYSYINSKKMV